MFFQDPLGLSRLFLDGLGTQVKLAHLDRIPESRSILVVSNHRSFMDAPLLMTALSKSIQFACHHYMSQIPVLRETVQALGCFPLEAPNQSQQGFFDRANCFLQARKLVGVFPEGGQRMVRPSSPREIAPFQRGFAHLAMRSPVPKLAVLPVAIISQDESTHLGVPLPLLHFFDPSEPLFEQMGWHPIVVYHKVKVAIGHPYWITPTHKAQYRGKQGKAMVGRLTQYCQQEIAQLLHQEGVY
ncbi:lysophospholipid acyltransferase family protein [Altericista sp. CCNU0014]|uniref:lysophospholipid acyltransferase family protein n=1 Tax=Altericista sp. CCNU0014 TaxID=3082949 RepID=UPI00384AC46C